MCIRDRRIVRTECLQGLGVQASGRWIIGIFCRSGSRGRFGGGFRLRLCSRLRCRFGLSLIHIFSTLYDERFTYTDPYGIEDTYFYQGPQIDDDTEGANNINEMIGYRFGYLVERAEDCLLYTSSLQLK